MADGGLGVIGKSSVSVFERLPNGVCGHPWDRQNPVIPHRNSVTFFGKQRISVNPLGKKRLTHCRPVV